MCKKHILVRFFIILIITWVEYSFLVLDVDAGDDLKEEQKKIIYIVYDNSSSTYSYKNTVRDYWSEINYGVQIFYTMTDEEDVIKLYFTSTEDRLSLNGYKGDNESGNALDDIEGIKLSSIDISLTNIRRVEDAVQDLDSAGSGDEEKWIVIFTDGAFEKDTGSEYSPEEAAKLLKGYLEGKDDIKACYIPVVDEAKNPYLDKNIFFQPMDAGNIAGQLVEVCSHIYGRRTVKNVKENGYEATELKDGILTINFDIPISRCIVYAYCDKLVIGELTGDAISWQECIQAPQTFISGQNLPSEKIKAVEKTGFVTGLSVNPLENKSAYKVLFPDNISDMEYEVYYEPAFQVTPAIRQDRIDVTEGNLLAGEFEVGLEYSNSQTGDSFDGDADFLSVEEFSVNMVNNGNEESLGSITGQESCSGYAQPGTAVISASTIGISGEKEAVFYKDYGKAELSAVLDDVYYMDRLGKDRPYIRLEALLDGENITGEVQGLLDKDETADFSYYLVKDGSRCRTVAFEKEYDNVEQCWKLYPVYEGETDYLLNGDYSFEACIKVKTDYSDKSITIEMTEDEVFHTGVSEGMITVQIERPWICNIHGGVLILADDAEVSFEWQGEKLPASVLSEITVNGTKDLQPDITYQMKNDRKNKIEMKHSTLWARFCQQDGTDRISLEGSAVLFGQQRQIDTEDILVEIHGLSTFGRIVFCIFWLLIIIVAALIVILFACYKRGVKKGTRFPLKTKVYRCFADEKNCIKGTLKRKRKKDTMWRHYTQYTISVYLPQEFKMKNNMFEVKIRRWQQKVEILYAEKPKGCKEILFGNVPYAGKSMEMKINDQIELTGDKCIVKIWLDV